MIPKPQPEHSVLIVYDLRDPAQWEQARADRAAWGRAFSVVHTLDPDHVLIDFRPGGGQSQAAA
jgi:hypothetical protein